MSGKLIIGGKAWGEFENAKRTKGSIEISGYRSYGGTHTVRMIEQSQLNDNQQIILDWLKLQPSGVPFYTFCLMMHNTALSKLDGLYEPILELNRKQQAEIMQVYSQWLLDQEDENV